MDKTLEELTEERAEPRIAAELEHLAVPVDELSPHPENPRRGDVGSIAASLERFGQLKPILALPDGTIVAGHHVYYAALHLGWPVVAAVREAMDEEKARAYLLADNRISDLGTYDGEALATVLSDVASAGELAGTGYKEEDVKRFLADLERDPDGGGGGGRDGATGERDERVRCPVCGRPAKVREAE